MDDELGRSTISYKGLFDLNGLMAMMKSWLASERFDVTEKKFKQKGSSTGLELEVEWECKKKVTRYVKWFIYVTIMVWDGIDTDVIRDNEKVKLIKGRMRVVLYGKIEKDWEGSFNKSAFLINAKKIYEKYIIASDIGLLEKDALIKRVYELHKNTKGFMDMESAYSAY